MIVQMGQVASLSSCQRDFHMPFALYCQPEAFAKVWTHRRFSGSMFLHYYSVNIYKAPHNIYFFKLRLFSLNTFPQDRKYQISILSSLISAYPFYGFVRFFSCFFFKWSHHNSTNSETTLLAKPKVVLHPICKDLTPGKGCHFQNAFALWCCQTKYICILYKKCVQEYLYTYTSTSAILYEFGCTTRKKTYSSHS